MWAAPGLGPDVLRVVYLLSKKDRRDHCYRGFERPGCVGQRRAHGEPEDVDPAPVGSGRAATTPCCHASPRPLRSILGSS
jgi:hypothetical protein